MMMIFFLLNIPVYAFFSPSFTLPLHFQGMHFGMWVVGLMSVMPHPGLCYWPHQQSVISTSAVKNHGGA